MDASKTVSLTIEAYRQGMYDAINSIVKTISEKGVNSTEELLPALLFALKELSEKRTIH